MNRLGLLECSGHDLYLDDACGVLYLLRVKKPRVSALCIIECCGDFTGTVREIPVKAYEWRGQHPARHGLSRWRRRVGATAMRGCGLASPQDGSASHCQ